MKRLETTKDTYHPDYYTQWIENESLEEVEKYIYGLTKGAKKEIAGKIAIEKYNKKQEDIRNERRDEREKNILELSKKANHIAQDANLLSKVAIFVSFVAIVASAWVVIATKTG